MSTGVLIAADAAIEWMIPWWVQHFYKRNDIPVAFIDLGVSQDMRERIQSFDYLITPTLPNLILDKSKIDPQSLSAWEQAYPGDLFKVRKSWLAKPFLFAQSPFQKTLWLDVDCEVRSSIAPIINLCENPSGLAIAHDSHLAHTFGRELGIIQPDETLYNGGVVCYKKESPLLKRWIDEVKQNHHLYFSDQEALTRIIYKEKPSFTEIPYTYNSRIWDRDGDIIHYANPKGKHKLLRQLLTEMNQ